MNSWPSTKSSFKSYDFIKKFSTTPPLPPTYPYYNFLLTCCVVYDADPLPGFVVVNGACVGSEK